MSDEGHDLRAGLAATAFGLVAATSYVVQRLASFVGGEAPASTVLMSAHVPFYWRVGLSCFQGLIVAGILYLAVPEEAAGRWLPRLGRLVLPGTLALIAASFLVP